MTLRSETLPIIRSLPTGLGMDDIFGRLCHLPGLLWLDSAVGGHYSFLTADPVRSLIANVDDPDPWPTLRRWCRDLPLRAVPDLPPFQGGIAGLVGYEAVTWLEPVGMAADNDLPTPAISLGLYDWTIAFDHRDERAMLICNGLGDTKAPIESAIHRADQIMSLLRHEPTALAAGVEPEPTAPAAGNEPEPEPIRRGGLAAGVEPMNDGMLTHQHATKRPDIFSSFTGQEFRHCVADIVNRIHQGDSFQVNLAQRLLRRADMPSAELYLRLRKSNPAPYGAYYVGDGFEVISSSPEGFLSVRDGLVQTRPIKGTAPRVGDPRPDALLAHKLRVSEKDRAENIMIVDLMRNDLSRVCDDDSVNVQKLCQIETYQYVQHLVSVVEGRLRADQTVVDLLAACFPGGSVTGAPKIEAMRTIAELEKNPRGPYCGSIGYMSTSGDADFNILIRTITAAHGYWQIPVGGGITARSNPQTEEAETWSKAEGMLRAFAAK